MKRILYLLAVCIFASCARNEFVNTKDLVENGRQKIPLHHESIIRNPSFVMNVLDVMRRLYPSLYDDISSGYVEMEQVEYTTEAFHVLHPDIELTIYDTIFHIINFGENSGFVVFADNYGIVALTDNGHFDINAMINPRNIEAEDASGFIPTDEIYSLIDLHSLLMIQNGTLLPHGDGPDYYDCGKSHDRVIDTCELYEHTPPMVEINPGQGYPYNLYCPNNVCDTGRYSAGCGPIALTMLFSVFRYPSEINYFGQVSLDWNETIIEWRDDYIDRGVLGSCMYDFAKYIRKIGLVFCAQYHCDGTWFAPTQIDLVLNNNSNFDRFHDCNQLRVDGTINSFDPVINSIVSGKPVIFFSNVESASCSADFSDAHYFVTDGYAAVRSKHVTTYERCPDETYYVADYSLVHCNWGWEGMFNGYYRYLFGFNEAEGAPFGSEYVIDDAGSADHDGDVYNRDRIAFVYEFNY